MQTYIALLRAINVGGNSIIKMADLKQIFESLGYSNIRTHIQSGNVVFEASETDRTKIAATVEQALQSRMNYLPKAFILTAEDLKKAASDCPFEHNSDQICQVLFLDSEPPAENKDKLMAVEGGDYKFAYGDKVLYYAYDRSLGGQRRTINFEKILGATGTARNLGVVNKLIELAA